MVWLIAFFLTVSGLFFTYVAVGLVRNKERQRGYLECEDRLDILRKQLLRRRGAS
jgi:hypothetical protein